MEPLNAFSRLTALREEIRNHLSAFLMDTSPEKPYRCEIQVSDGPCAAYVIAMFQHPTEGYIGFLYDWMDDDSDFAIDFDDMWTDDLVTILDEVESV